MFTFAVDLLEDLMWRLGMRGCFRSFQPVMKWRILIIRSRTEVKVPR